MSSTDALAGLKKSCAASVPSARTPSRTTDWDKFVGGALPGPSAAVTPLPVDRKMRPAPSETSPPPACQMPDMKLFGPLWSDHIVTCWLVTLTPATQPT